jgi:ribosomal protein L19
LKNGRQWPQIKAGDSIQIEKLPYMTSNETEVIKGVVIGRTNKLVDSTVRLLNVRLKVLWIYQLIDV